MQTVNQTRTFTGECESFVSNGRRRASPGQGDGRYGDAKGRLRSSSMAAFASKYRFCVNQTCGENFEVGVICLPLTGQSVLILVGNYE